MAILSVHPLEDRRRLEEIDNLFSPSTHEEFILEAQH